MLDPDYPLSVFREAIKTTIGWTLAVGIVTGFALTMGYWAGYGTFPEFSRLPGLLFFLIATSIFHPLTLLADLVTAAIWGVFLVMEAESLASHAVALFVLLLIWLAVGFGLGDYYQTAFVGR